MPEENQDDQIEEEMLRMMQEEAEGEAPDGAGEGAGADADPESEMLNAMQEEMGAVGGGEEGQDADADLEAQMLSAMVEETGASEGVDATALQQAVLPSADVSPAPGGGLLDIKLSVAIELGSAQVPIQTVLEWTEGSLIELAKVSGEAVDVMINGKPIARGEVVTIAENFGVRITQLLPTIPRG